MLTGRRRSWGGRCRACNARIHRRSCLSSPARRKSGTARAAVPVVTATVETVGIGEPRAGVGGAVETRVGGGVLRLVDEQRHRRDPEAPRPPPESAWECQSGAVSFSNLFDCDSAADYRTRMVRHVLLLACVSLSMSTACSDNSESAPAGKVQAETPVGTPTGPSASSTVGSSGGVVVSADGRLENRGAGRRPR